MIKVHQEINSSHGMKNHPESDLLILQFFVEFHHESNQVEDQRPGGNAVATMKNHNP